MFERLLGRGRWFKTGLVATALLVGLSAGSALIMPPAPAEAHCDSIEGPVVTAARVALEKGDVKYVLPYVQPDDEAELTKAFEDTMVVRKRGNDAQQLADRYFFETTVRLHRIGEGAPYTGLKVENEHNPALEAADYTLESGSLSEVFTVLSESVHTGVKARYQEVVEARELEAAEGTVAAARERAEAELIFEKYILSIYEAAEGKTLHSEGATTGTVDAHGTTAPVATHVEPSAVD